MTARKGLLVEYRGPDRTVRTRIERNEWTVSIHPADIESPKKVVTGPRERAERLARSMKARRETQPGAVVNLYNRLNPTGCNQYRPATG